MTRNISVEGLDQIPIERQRIELVERKCLGHPDSLADGIAESISRALSRAYLEECGTVLHHNTDQGRSLQESIEVRRRPDHETDLLPHIRDGGQRLTA